MTGPIRPKTIGAPSDQKSRFVALQRPANLLEVEDTFFNTGSAVFLPDVPGGATLDGAQLLPFSNAPLLAELGLSQPVFTADLLAVPFDPDVPGGGDAPERESGLHVILAALQFLATHPSHQLIVAGHTDRAGDDAFNQRLSLARAKNVLALLEGKRADFVASCSTFHAKDDEPIVFRFAARSRGFQTETVDSDAATPEEIREFQRQFNEKMGVSIRVTGTVTDATHGAYFDLYEAELTERAGGIEALASMRSHLRFVDPAHKAIGFGERFPRENPGQDGLRSQLNRRVELLFFAAPRLPVPSAPDVGEQLFRRRLFAFSVLDREGFADKSLVTAPTVTALAITPTDLVPDDPLTTSMAQAGVFNSKDAWAFLEPFDDLHPDEGIVPPKRNSRERPLGARPKPQKPHVPPGPLPNV